ncbi:Amylo-alpha-1,6-glucosidase, partial [Ostertagia ostertagi]
MNRAYPVPVMVQDIIAVMRFGSGLHSIERYVREAPSGQQILHSPVRRIYPEDDTVFGDYEREEPLMNVMAEALQRHFAGIDFRERNAGHQIDEHMRDEGWQSRREPATPRDGAAVEIQALAYSVLNAMSEWANAGVINKNGDESWAWSEWAEKIKSNFEQQFFIDENHDGQFVNQRNILKDTVGSTLEFTDYQLRCNFVVALATAPTLIDPHKAWLALDMAKEHLLGPLGMKTLDPSDWAYNGDYNNNDDGVNKKTAKGWNYHQGPVSVRLILMLP